MRGASFSRTGATSPLGKLDAELPKQRISGQTLGRLQQLASDAGLPLAEFLRIHLDVIAFGVDTVKRMHADRVDQVVRIGGEKG